MKKIEDLTLKEYEIYKEELDSNDFNILRILEIFGIKDPDKLDVQELKKVTDYVINSRININPLKEEYTIKDKTFKAVLEIKDIKAAQYIDFQSYMKNYKLQNVLSIFLLPIEYGKSRIFHRRTKRVLAYNDGYDIIEVQNLIYENFKIGDALALSGFFFNLSEKLIPIMANSLTFQMMVKAEKIRRGKKI